MSLHANYTLNPATLQTPCKSLIQTQSSALLGYPSLLLTILKRATRSTLRQLDSAQTEHYSTQNDFPVPLFITNIVLTIKTHLGGQTHKKR